MSLDGKVAMVTGAGRGLGRGIAQVFAERGGAIVNFGFVDRAVAAPAGDDLSYLTGASLMLDRGSMLVN